MTVNVFYEQRCFQDDKGNAVIICYCIEHGEKNFTGKNCQGDIKCSIVNTLVENNYKNIWQIMNSFNVKTDIISIRVKL